MNVVNRVVVVILLLVAIMSCSLVLVGSRWVLPAIAQQSAALAEAVEDLAWYQLELPGGAVALVLDVILLIILVLELRRSSRKAIRVERAAGGEVRISVASIADRMKYAVDQLANVLRTRSRVTGNRKGVVVELDVEVATEANVPEKAEQVVEVVRRVIEEDMGLKLARLPKVNLRVVPYPKAGGSPIEPEPPSLAPEPEPEPLAFVPEPEPEPVSFAEPAEWSPINLAFEPEPETTPDPGLEEEDLPDLPEDFGEFGGGPDDSN